MFSVVLLIIHAYEPFVCWNCSALYVAALPLKCIFLLDLIGPLRTMHALSVGEVYYVLKSGLIQSFHTWFLDLFGMIFLENLT